MNSDSAVVVLGMRVGKNGPSPELKGRIDVGMEVARKTGSQYIVFTGGVTNPEIQLSEAKAMAIYIDEEYPGNDRTTILEEEALDTLGNGIFTSQLLRKYPQVSTIFVVTSCYHVERSRFIFQHCFADQYSVIFNDCFLVDSHNAALEAEKFPEIQQFFQTIELEGRDPVKALFETKMYNK